MDGTSKRPIPHGTLSGFKFHRCRCPECKEANRVARARAKVRLRADPIPEDAHGKRSTYVTRGCRCEACTAVAAPANLTRPGRARAHAASGEAAAYFRESLAHHDRDGGCWEWPFARNSDGYGTLGVAATPAGRLVHRQAFELAYGYVPPVCRHTCDNPPCFNPAHLVPGVQADNVRDTIERGRNRRGEAHYGAKLTEADVREIRRLVADGVDQATLAARFGVSGGLISSVVRRARWKHVV